MKILIVSTNDFGGAGKACIRLHLGLLKNGIDSKLLLLNKKSNYPKTYVFRNPESHSFLKRLGRKAFKILYELKLVAPHKKSFETEFIANREKGLERFSFPNSIYDITESEHYEQADIINLHWVADFLDYDSFFKKNKKPVIWTLHDMNPFSGGEHYEEKYLGMNSIGLPISRKVSNEEKKLFDKVLKIKERALLDTKDLHFVTLSNWMTKEVQKSDFFGNFPIHQIPNGIDSNYFTIRDKAYSRNLLDIALEKKVILFVADLINTNRKGFDFLVKAIEKLKQPDFLLFVIGEKNKKFERATNIIQYGTVNDDKLLSAIYSAADVFVIPSIMDNLPNTVLESLLCGTPVIGFNIGGIPDMVENGKNGLIANEISVDSLANSISSFLNTGVIKSREEISENARTKFDQKVQTNNYIKLFERLSTHKLT